MGEMKITNRTVWLIQLPLEQPDRWFTVATCDTPGSAAEVVRMLLPYRVDGAGAIRIVPDKVEVVQDAV